MAAAMTQGMTAEQATQYADALDVIYANDPRRPKIDRLRPKGKRALAAVADVPPDGSEAAAAAMAALPPPVPDRAPDGDVLTIDAGGQVWPSDDRAQLPAESRAAPQAVPLPEPCHACGAEFAHGDGDELVCDGCGLVLATDDGGA
jgi:hypothetical protein